MFGKKKTSIPKDRLNRVIGRTEDEAPNAEPASQPRAVRETAWATCRLTWTGGSDSGVLLDISKTGARVRFNHRPSLPAVVRLHVNAQSIKVDAEVVRVDDVDVGLRFLSPI